MDELSPTNSFLPLIPATPLPLQAWASSRDELKEALSQLTDKEKRSLAATMNCRRVNSMKKLGTTKSTSAADKLKNKKQYQKRRKASEASGGCSQQPCVKPVFRSMMCVGHFNSAFPEKKPSCCKVLGCNSKKQARCDGLCRKHFKVSKEEKGEKYEPAAFKPCKVTGCLKRQHARCKGMCKRHFTENEKENEG